MAIAGDTCGFGGQLASALANKACTCPLDSTQEWECAKASYSTSARLR